MSSKSVNLVPRARLNAYRASARLRAWGIAVVVYAVLAVAACVTARVMWGNDLKPLEDNSQAIAARVRSTQSRLAAASGKLRVQSERKATAAEVMDHLNWGEVLGVITHRMGDSVVLRNLRAQCLPNGAAARVNSPAIPSARAAGRSRTYRLELRGLAHNQASAATFVSALEATGIFDQVRLIRTAGEPFANRSATSFEIECTMIDGGHE